MSRRTAPDLTIDPCDRCGAWRWQEYPPDAEGMRMICTECNNIAPLEFRILDEAAFTARLGLD